MVDPYDTVRESPVDFSFAVAYASQPAVRRLVILQLVGAIFVRWGDPSDRGTESVVGLIWWAIDLGVLLAGIALVVTGIVGLLLKLVTDANRLAA